MIARGLVVRCPDVEGPDGRALDRVQLDLEPSIPLRAGDYVMVIGRKPKEARDLVVLESPYMGGDPRAVFYAKLALLDSVRAGEAPLASHLLYPQVLDDHDGEDRFAGIRSGWEPLRHGARTIAYVDLGITRGMAEGIAQAKSLGRPIGYRSWGPHVLGVLDAAIARGFPQQKPKEVYAQLGCASATSWP